MASGEYIVRPSFSTYHPSVKGRTISFKGVIKYATCRTREGSSESNKKLIVTPGEDMVLTLL